MATLSWQVCRPRRMSLIARSCSRLWTCRAFKVHWCVTSRRTCRNTASPPPVRSTVGDTVVSNQRPLPGSKILLSVICPVLLAPASGQAYGGALVPCVTSWQWRPTGSGAPWGNVACSVRLTARMR